MSIKWSKDKVEALIGLVFQQPILWDKTVGPKDPKEMSNIWFSIAKELSVGKDQARNKWRSLQTKYFKVEAEMPKCRSGDAASNPKQWCYYTAMSFLKDKVYGESSGNLDFMDNCSEHDSDQDMPKVKNATCSALVTAKPIKPCPLAAVNEAINITEAMGEFQDPVSQSEWLFLLSVVDYYGKVKSEKLKVQLRIESYLLVFNYLTDNKEVIDSAKQKEKSKITEGTSKRKRSREAMPHGDGNEKHSVKETGVLNLKSEAMDEDDNEVLVSNCCAVQVKNEQSAAEKEIDVKPSAALQNWLINPIVVKKEF